MEFKVKYFLIDKNLQVSESENNDFDRNEAISVIKYSVTNNVFIPSGYFAQFSKKDKVKKYNRLYAFEIEGENIPINFFKILKLKEQKDSNLKRNYYRELKFTIQDSQGNIRDFFFYKNPNDIPFKAEEIQKFLFELKSEFKDYPGFAHIKSTQKEMLEKKDIRINNLNKKIKELRKEIQKLKGN